MNGATYFEDFAQIPSRTTAGRTITETDVVIHAGHTGDFYPHHVDAHWAAESEFGQRIAHGTLVLSVAAGLAAGAINPVSFSYGYDRVRFVAPVRLGDTIHVEVEIGALREDPKRAGRGFVDEICSVIDHDGRVVLVFTHVHSVERRAENGSRMTPSTDKGESC